MHVCAFVSAHTPFVFPENWVNCWYQLWCMALLFRFSLTMHVIVIGDCFYLSTRWKIKIWIINYNSVGKTMGKWACTHAHDRNVTLADDEFGDGVFLNGSMILPEFMCASILFAKIVLQNEICNDDNDDGDGNGDVFVIILKRNETEFKCGDLVLPLQQPLSHRHNSNRKDFHDEILGVANEKQRMRLNIVDKWHRGCPLVESIVSQFSYFI